MKVTALIRAAAFATAAAALLSGCASSGGSAASGGATSKGALAMSFPTQDVNIWKQQLDLMQPIVKKAGYELLSDNPNWDIQTQVNDWTSWIQRGDVKAIMGFPVQADSMVSVTAQAKSADIPVIGYAGSWDGTSAKLVLDVKGAGAEVGEAAGKWIKGKFGSQTVEVGLLADTRADLGRLQAAGITEGLKASGANTSVYNLEASSRDDGYKAAQTQLVAHPQTKVWLGIGADMTLGARQAVIDSGVSPSDPSRYVSATDGNDEVYKLIQSGNDIWRETQVWSPEDLAEADAKLLISAAEGTPSGDINVPTRHVTKDTAAGMMSK
ncbi:MULTISPECIES: substrate-binding domain-containing protein [Arthrobacter]|uniref:Sugar ABC transporter substrate-binding protein n=1 Tax=Arthrobacter terricola TaxID=2547396 RepID=A0A4R5KBA3_9MICC|nr:MULTISPECIES: substrate-binding domain-containing protein [Arthrobacter]MBT8162672.1 substrate-binding domain-containing protein [Arthrobacter sp. GN70]TDF92449.1 sugar ABC transporter substrate-binding protein [Arthrobacter terricola]